MVKSQDNQQKFMSKKLIPKSYQNYSHYINNWPVTREISKGWFPLTRFWLRTLTVNFNHVNKIEAGYKVLRLNVNLSEVLLLRLRATFHTRQWKSISVVLGLRRWHDALRSSVRIARFLPASCPVQRSSVEVTSKFRPSYFPCWQLISIDIQSEYSGILFRSPQPRKQWRITSTAGFVGKKR